MTILCEPSAEQVASLAGAIDGLLPVADLSEVSDALSAHPGETVLVLGAGLPLERALDFTGWLHQQRPGVGIILLRDDLEVSELMAAMRAGVREVIPASDTAAVTDACRRYQQVIGHPGHPVHPAQGGRAGGTIVTVFSAKGGCGKTTLSTNLSVALAQAGQRVCLVDLDLAFGDVAITLGLTPARTLVDVLALGDALDQAKVATLVTPYQPDLDCVLAPVIPGEAERIPVTGTSALLDVLSGMYDYIVVDTPAQVTEHVLAALDASHQQVLITTPEIPALKNLRVTLDMLDLLSYDRGGRTIVLNRSDAQVGLSPADIESVVKAPISGQIPSSRDVPVSINRGEPIVAQSPGHPVSVAITRFTNSYVHRAPATDVSKDGRNGRRGMLKLRRRMS